MRDLEFSRNISIGRYMDTGSALHRLSPGTKYILLLALFIPALGTPSPMGALLPFAVSLWAGRLAGLKGTFLLRSLKPTLPVFVLVACLQFLFGWPGDESGIILSLGPFAATRREAWIVLLVLARTVSTIAMISLFTAVTSEAEAARGIEDALAPLSRIGIKSHRLALAVATALRFVPIVASELEAVVKAQASRGARFGTARGGPLARARSYLPLFIPVTIRALERAELLAEAMEARGYTGEGRSRYAVYPSRPGEPMIRFLALVLSAGVFALDLFMLAPRIRPF